VLYANVDGEKREAEPGMHGKCPGCGAEVLAKCGEINIWHWSHLAGPDCDPWFEGESQWHLSWKKLIDRGRCEVVMGCHRADIVSPDGWVIELQHSSLSPEVVRERENFYGDMAWIIDCSEFEKRMRFRDKGDYHTFYYTHPRKWMMSITKPLYFDVSRGLFCVKKWKSNNGGWGRFVDASKFLRHMGAGTATHPCIKPVLSTL
jgi:competence protein CoiA